MRKKILVVEDNECNMRLLTDLLRHYGYSVIQAINGLEAIHSARNNSPDLIMMDMQMPVMDGFDAIKQLREDERTARIKIIAVTSFAMSEEKQRILKTGVDHYLAKPINTRKLPQIIKKIIG